MQYSEIISGCGTRLPTGITQTTLCELRDARTKYFEYFGQSRIVTDTALEGGSPECVENLTKIGLVKAGAESL